MIHKTDLSSMRPGERAYVAATSGSVLASNILATAIVWYDRKWAAAIKFFVRSPASKRAMKSHSLPKMERAVGIGPTLLSEPDFKYGKHQLTY